jgi:uncharacterized protein (DUF433 family)
MHCIKAQIDYSGSQVNYQYDRLGSESKNINKLFMLTTLPIVHSDPDILGGTPVFNGTRVPIKTLIDYLKAGDSLNEFLDHFPSVSRDRALTVLDLAEKLLTAYANPT